MRRYLLDDGGATSIEYGVLALLVSIGILASATRVSTGVTRLFNTVVNGVSGSP